MAAVTRVRIAPPPVAHQCTTRGRWGFGGGGVCGTITNCSNSPHTDGFKVKCLSSIKKRKC